MMEIGDFSAWSIRICFIHFSFNVLLCCIELCRILYYCNVLCCVSYNVAFHVTLLLKENSTGRFCINAHMWRFILYIVCCVLCVMHCVLCIVCYALCVMHCVLYIVCHALCVIHCVLYTVCYALCVMHCVL